MSKNILDYSFSLKRCRYGWLLCGPQLGGGAPLDAMQVIGRLVSRAAIMDIGICHYYRYRKPETHAVMAVADNRESGKAWRAAITEDLVLLPPEQRWWYGVDVGASSATIFYCLGRLDGLLISVEDYIGPRGSTPRDSDDLGRCLRLLKLFPDWKGRLDVVAARYPDWKPIVACWDKLETATPEEQTRILHAIP